MTPGRPAVGEEPNGGAGFGFLILSLAVILLSTLTPLPEWPGAKAHVFDILSSGNAVLDALENALLFLPLGLAQAFHRWRPLPSILIGGLVSLAIEIIQIVIPGRDPSLQDFCCNILGTFLGIRLAGSSLGRQLARSLAWCRRVWEQWKRPGPGLASRLMFGSVILSTLVFALTGWLLAPAFLDGPYLIAAKDMDSGPTLLRIGSNGDDQGHFRGTIDEVRIYDRARTCDAIRLDMVTPISADLRSPPGLVAAYSFDEREGGHVFNASGAGNDGALDGAVRTTVGRFGGAVVFDGNGDAVVIPHTSVLDLRTAFTLEAWVRPEVGPDVWPAVIEKGGDLYFLYAGSDSGSLVPAGGGTFGGANEDVRAPAALRPSIWSHLAATYDGSALQVFINGQRVAKWTRWFGGRICRVLVAGTEFPPGLVSDWRDLSNALQTGASIRLQGVTGPRMSDPAALMDIQDTQRHHQIMIAAHGEDLVLRFATVAAALDLASPDIRVPDALRGLSPGSPIDLELRGRAGERSLSVNGELHGRLGFTLGMGWTPLVYSRYFPAWLQEVLDLLWMGALSFLTGFWARWRWGSAGAVLLLGCGTLILPAVEGLLSTPFGEWAAVAGGFLAGVCLRWLASAR